MRKKKVLLGMSGGIDSSMAAIVLQKQGYEVIGTTFKMYNSEIKFEVREIAEKLNIKHFYINLQKKFSETVISYFINEYKKGRTPSPCIFCNETLKFPALLEKAKDIGADFVATGHYSQKTIVNNKYYILRGIDEKKDQSYYLWRLDQETLKRTLFPLGDKTKDEVRLLAQNTVFTFLLKKKESMGVCFLQNTNYRDFLKNNFPGIFQNINKGDVMDRHGRIIGTHHGYPFYTVGQKSGMDIHRTGSFYVSKIDADKNLVYVSGKSELNQKEFIIDNYFFQEIQDINNRNVCVNVRGLGVNPKGNCEISIINKRTAKVKLENDAWAIAPGQPVVFFIGNRVIGGGYVS